MEFPHDTATVYVPDFDLDTISNDGFIHTDSSTEYSMSTLTTSQVADYFRNIFGYRFSVDENIPFVLPVTTESAGLARLIHMIIRTSQDGENVPSQANQMLRAGTPSGQTGGSRVLEVFTNCGTWVQEMAEHYPNATFLSIDVKPLVPHQPHPRIVFEVYDLYAGIAEPDSCFDLVKAPGCVALTKNFNFLLREMHRVLKPNGMLVITELPPYIYDGDNPSELHSSAPHQTAALRLFCEGMESQGIDLKVWEDLCARLSPDHPLWKERLIDPVIGVCELPSTSGSIRGFHDIQRRVRLVPIGAWSEDVAQQIMGSMSSFLAIKSFEGMLPLLLMMGMQKPDAQDIVDKGITEIKDERIRGFFKCFMWSARKL